MARRKSRQELAGVFDWFKKKPREERGLTVPSEDRPAPSMFDAFRPSLPAARPEESQLPAAPVEERRGGWMRLFEAFSPSRSPAPAQEPPPSETLPAPAEEPVAPSLWERVFGPPAAPGEPIPSEMITPPPTAAEILPVEIFQQQPPERREGAPRYTYIRLPRLQVGQWATPTPHELGEHFRKIFDTERIFQDIRATRDLPEWAQGIVDRAEKGMPISLQIDPVVHQNFFTDFAKLYGIPWNVMEAYLAGANTDAEVAAAQEQVLRDIIDPMNQRVGEAFDLIKPPDLPGWFWVGFDESSNTWWLYYLEAMLQPQRLPFRGEPRG